MAFEGIESRIKLINQMGKNPRNGFGGGGNASEKDQDLMAIKASGSTLETMAFGNMVVLSRPVLQASIDFDYGQNTPENEGPREDRYQQFLTQSIMSKDKTKIPSVESAPHHLLHKYVLHMHPTALTTVSCVAEGAELLRDWTTRFDFATTDFLVPGILLGKRTQELIQGYGGVPDGIFQRNHGMFFSSDRFEDLIALFNMVVGVAQAKIDDAIREKGLTADKEPYGKIERVFRRIDADSIINAIYKTIFKTTPDFLSKTFDFTQIEPCVGCYRLASKEGCVYLDVGPHARAYAQAATCPKQVDSLSHWSPDHLVYIRKHPVYIDLSRTDNQHVIQRDVERSIEGKTARCYVIGGVGIATVGGNYNGDEGKEERNARWAMNAVHDALLIAQGTRAIGNPVLLAQEYVDFINDRWKVEARRRNA